MKRELDKQLLSLRAHKQNRSRQAALFVASELLETRRLFASMVWNPGASGGVWDYTTKNWYQSGDPSQTPALFSPNDAAIFNDTGAGTVTIQAVGVTPASTTFNN